ncbi:MAG TPA: NAD-dependent malic enzyme [Rhizomicrobium sp.]|nr:NAD-dependent malic enzyme [Rhizomicrobium sp.]
MEPTPVDRQPYAPPIPFHTELSGYELLSDAALNKGTAFTDAERDMFGLHGLLPPHVGSLDEQISRRLNAIRSFETDLERYAFLRELQDTNETLFYALLVRHIEELLPIVYTPTVGAGCEQFSRLYRKPRGLFLSYPHQDRIAQILANPRFDRVEAIVVTDGGRILGLGDQGAGGMGIPIGKLSLYVCCAGLDPATTLPVILDVGTDNPERLADPLYIGWRHERIRDAHYDEFVDAFVAAVMKRWPHVLLQWEDFARPNANRLLARYRDRLCTFNDDIQGTAAVAAGALLAAVNVTGLPLVSQRIAVFGAGSAGCGIASLLRKILVEAGLTAREAQDRFFLVDRSGLLLDGTPEIESFQCEFVRSRDSVAGWTLENPDTISLYDVVRNAKPTVLIGVSGQSGGFPERVVRAMAAQTERPVIFPLSNPTSRCEATPSDLLHWTAGRAIVGTGSPFAACQRNGAAFKIDQTNNTYIFPGVGLAAVAVKARRVSDGMFIAAARALAAASPASRDSNANLLPAIGDLRDLSVAMALSVAVQARREGLTDIATDDIEAAIRAKMWQPEYRPYVRAR